MKRSRASGGEAIREGIAGPKAGRKRVGLRAKVRRLLSKQPPLWTPEPWLQNPNSRLRQRHYLRKNRMSLSDCSVTGSRDFRDDVAHSVTVNDKHFQVKALAHRRPTDDHYSHVFEIKRNSPSTSNGFRSVNSGHADRIWSFIASSLAVMKTQGSFG